MSEPIPSAVARGPEAETPGAIAPVRAGMFVGALAAIFVFVTYVVAPLPSRALDLVGADGEGLGRYGGLRMVWAPPPGTDAGEIEQALRVRTENGGRVVRDGDALVIDVPGVSREEGERSAQLIAKGGVNFHRTVIVKETIYLAEPPFSVPMPDETDPALGLQLAIDVWSGESGKRMTDYYLLAATREELAAEVTRLQGAGWKLPGGTHVAYEHVKPWSGSQLAYWRTHVIEDEPALSGAHIATAVRSSDPNTLRPIILLDFDREGAHIFGEVTAGMIDRKLATVLAGDVVSAPIIMGAILGGRASISMGGTDPREQERERDALVGVLEAGPLPPGGELRRADYVPPSNGAASEWLARLLLSLGAGLLAGVLAWAVVRSARPVWRGPQVQLPGSIAWPRLGVLLVVPLVLVGGSYVTAPGLDSDQLIFVLFDDSKFNITMLGVGPLISSYLIVELVATIVPRWRRRRHAGDVARLPLDVAAIVLAGVLSIAQSYFMAVYLDAIDAAPLGFDRLIFFAGMAGATMGFAGLAAVVRRYGLGTGLVTIVVVSYGLELYRRFEGVWSKYEAIPAFTTTDKVLGLVGIAVFAVITIVALRLRISRAGEVPLRVPASGHAPVYEATGLLSVLIAFLGLFGATTILARLNDVYVWSLGLEHWIVLLLVIAFTVLWSWAFASPSALRPHAERAGLAPPSLQSWRAATLVSIATLVAIIAGYWVLHAAPGAMLGSVQAVLVAAVGLDVVDDLRGRRDKTARAWSLHSPQHADIAGRVLGEAGIAFHLTGANVRTILAWFGPFAPIDVHVRPEDATRARDLLANVFAPK